MLTSLVIFTLPYISDSLAILYICSLVMHMFCHVIYHFVCVCFLLRVAFVSVLLLFCRFVLILLVVLYLVLFCLFL